MCKECRRFQKAWNLFVLNSLQNSLRIDAGNVININQTAVIALR
jgi:hypothetical protein